MLLLILKGADYVQHKQMIETVVLLRVFNSYCDLALEPFSRRLHLLPTELSAQMVLLTVNVMQFLAQPFFFIVAG